MAQLIRITVELQLTLADRCPGGRLELAMQDGATVATMLQRLGLKDADAGLVVRNGLSLEPGEALHDGDALMVFPPLSGG